MNQWKHFKHSEFACKHCGENKMAPDFIDKLDLLREIVGVPLVVTSGYRCPVHNANVSTTGATGPHTSGRAVDFGVARGQALDVLRAALLSGDFTGIGVNQKGGSRFIHLDDLPNAPGQPRPTVWSY